MRIGLLATFLLARSALSNSEYQEDAVPTSSRERRKLEERRRDDDAAEGQGYAILDADGHVREPGVEYDVSSETSLMSRLLFGFSQVIQGRQRWQRQRRQPRRPRPMEPRGVYNVVLRKQPPPPQVRITPPRPPSPPPIITVEEVDCIPIPPIISKKGGKGKGGSYYFRGPGQYTYVQGNGEGGVSPEDVFAYHSSKGAAKWSKLSSKNLGYPYNDHYGYGYLNNNYQPGNNDNSYSVPQQANSANQQQLISFDRDATSVKNYRVFSFNGGATNNNDRYQVVNFGGARRLSQYFWYEKPPPRIKGAKGKAGSVYWSPKTSKKGAKGYKSKNPKKKYCIQKPVPKPVPTQRPVIILPPQQAIPAPTTEPSQEPVPTHTPTVSEEPSVSSVPTLPPTAMIREPTGAPTTAAPSASARPSGEFLPSQSPSTSPSNLPSPSPSQPPSMTPSGGPSSSPSAMPSIAPSEQPSVGPTITETPTSTRFPSSIPSATASPTTAAPSTFPPTEPPTSQVCAYNSKLLSS